jgi:hypothetical protein
MIREISDYLFATAAKKISSDQSLPHITAALLNISISAAYRKIKGETPLNTSEVFILSKHFGISLDAFNGQSTYTNNLILANNGDHYILVVTLDNPNYLVSTDERLTRHINGWFEQIRAKSTHISTGGEKHRTYYFNELRRRIQEAKRRPGV